MRKLLSFCLPVLAGLVMPAIQPPAIAAGMAAQGHELYNMLCARCHGINLGNPRPPAPDLHSFHDGHSEFVTMVQTGKGEMPPWKGVLSPAQIDEIWDYLNRGGR